MASNEGQDIPVQAKNPGDPEAKLAVSSISDLLWLGPAGQQRYPKPFQRVASHSERVRRILTASCLGAAYDKR